MDEPESLGAIGMAVREKLDNLIFVVNCNLQRLDGPVRGNGKIIQELEADFRGAGWNVLKIIWGGYWDALLERDHDGLLQRRMEEAVDGEYQNFKANDGRYVREHFFGKYPALLERVSHMSDTDIWQLNRGGHDPHKIYAAYYEAVRHTEQPTVILAKTIKGYGLGKAGQAKNPTHQLKKLDLETIRNFRDRFNIPIPDDQLEDTPFYRPPEKDPILEYLHERRQAMGGYLPQRRPQASTSYPAPALTPLFEPQLKGSGSGREVSTTMAFVRILTQIIREPNIGPLCVPIVPDEARTFGMEGMFRQLGIYSAEGQKYTPVDKDQVMYYREDKTGQILEEGINEAGAFCSWMAAATSYSNSNQIMIPFYIFYSMFGFQRIGDLAWAAGDLRARGFVLGATAGRTTLNGEGLQHEDGHSHLMSATVPNCVSYDPTYAYELAVIMQDGLRRMVQNQEDVYYYITLMNENYEHPPMPDGIAEKIIKGMYLLQRSAGRYTVQLLGSGTILREVEAAALLLEQDWKIGSNVWSCPSFTELRREGLAVERWNLLHPLETPRVPYVTENLQPHPGPVIAASDYMKSYVDGVRPFIPKGRTYHSLGTDGFGRSDTRPKLRHFFEVDRYWIVLSALKALADQQAIPAKEVAEAIRKYQINPEKADPTLV